MSYVWLLPTARTFVEQDKVKVINHLQLATLPLAADYCLSFLERLDGTHSIEELAQDPKATVGQSRIVLILIALLPALWTKRSTVLKTARQSMRTLREAMLHPAPQSLLMAPVL
jgi:hypothetical protein